MKLRELLAVLVLSSACVPEMKVFFFTTQGEKEVQTTSFLENASWTGTFEDGLFRYSTSITPLLPETEYYPCVSLSAEPLEEFPQLFFEDAESITQVAGEEGCFEVGTRGDASVVRTEQIALEVTVPINPGEILLLEFLSDLLPCDSTGDWSRCKLGIIEADSTPTFRLIKHSGDGFQYISGVPVDVIQAPWPQQEHKTPACDNTDGSYIFSLSQNGEVVCPYTQ